MTNHRDKQNFYGDVNIYGAFAITPDPNDPDAPVVTQQVVSRYVSQQITEADLSAGATCTVALINEPSAMIPIACYVVTDEVTSSGDAATTGLSAEIGIVSGDVDFLMKSTDVFTGAAGRKETAVVGVGLNNYRAADALAVKFTASGAGSEDCADIDNLSLRVVILYIPAVAEAA